MSQNNGKNKTRHVKFDTLQMSEYLSRNKSSTLSKTIFSVRSVTLDIKAWNSWNYENSLCVMCEMSDENIEHFMSCEHMEKYHGKWTGKKYMKMM